MHLKSVAIHPERFPTIERYPFNLAVIRETGRIDLDAPVTLLVGENGTGKSTLLTATARRCGIHIWRETERPRIEHNPFEERLADCLSVEWTQGPVHGSFFGSGIFQYFTEILDEWAAADPGQLKYFGGRSLLTMSHGQSLMAYFRSRYRIKGIYFLDEPETALSPRSQLELLDILARMGVDGHAQFLIATHSPILLSCPEAVIYSFDHVPVERVTYEETDHYRIYAGFMTDRTAFLRGPVRRE